MKEGDGGVVDEIVVEGREGEVRIAEDGGLLDDDGRRVRLLEIDDNCCDDGPLDPSRSLGNACPRLLSKYDLDLYPGF